MLALALNWYCLLDLAYICHSAMRCLAAMHPLQGSSLGFTPGVGGILAMITGLTVSTALTHVNWAHPVYVFITGVLVFRVVCA